jgi:hypothetical protein
MSDIIIIIIIIIITTIIIIIIIIIIITIIQKLDRKTRKMLTIHGQHHPRADIDRLYVPREEGGRGLMQVEGAYIAEPLNLVEYVESKEDPLIQIVRTHQHNTNSALLQTANKFKKFFQRETKQIKKNNLEFKRKMGKKDAWTIST